MMRSKIGQTEGNFAVVLFSLALPIFLTVAVEVKTHLTGAIWNMLICMIVNIILACFISNFFKIHGIKTIYKVTEIYYGKQISFVISLLINTAIFIYILYIFQNGCIKIFDANVKSPDFGIIKLFLIIVIAFSAIKGIEAITRTSYLQFFVVLFILSVLIFITSNGLKSDNIYPVLGDNIKETFIPGRFLGINFGLILYLMLADNFKSPKKLIFSVKKTCIIINAITLAIVIWYCFSVPNKIANTFDSGIEAVFSASVSGQVFRRFEIFMISLYIIIQSVCVGLGVFVISKSFADILHIPDYKPFSLILSVLIFNLTDIIVNPTVLSYMCIGIFLFTVILTFITNLRFKYNKSGE